jgi:hypothetical protein
MNQSPPPLPLSDFKLLQKFAAINLSPGIDDTGDTRVRIFKRLRSPGIDSKKGIPPAYVAWRAGTITLHIPTRLLAPMYCLKIPAQHFVPNFQLSPVSLIPAMNFRLVILILTLQSAWFYTLGQYLLTGGHQTKSRIKKFFFKTLSKLGDMTVLCNFL